MQKYDVKKAYPALYSPKGDSFSETVVPPLQYLAVDGEGDPNTAPAYAAAIEALYSASYTLKFQSKARGHDYVVGPLEALWTAAVPGPVADATDHARRGAQHPDSARRIVRRRGADAGEAAR
jgi:hypothetical protein